jgi:lysozyme
MTPDNEKKLRKMLSRHEGNKTAVYRCTAGHLTVGIGHKLIGNELDGAFVGMPFTVEEVERLYQEDLADAKGCIALLGLGDLDDVRRAALIDMAFNLGCGGLRGFKNALDAIRSKNWERAAREMLKSKWAGQVKGRADELAAMVRTGKWQK